MLLWYDSHSPLLHLQAGPAAAAAVHGRAVREQLSTGRAKAGTAKGEVLVFVRESAIQSFCVCENVQSPRQAFGRVEDSKAGIELHVVA